MPPVKWMDRTQPQTLQIATVVMYFNAVLDVIGGLFLLFFPLGLLLTVGSVIAALGIANQKKVGYWFAVGIAVLPLALIFASWTNGKLISLVFVIALVALLLHPQSREYRRIWFT